MALEYADRVKETSTTSGTGDFSLGGAATGFRTFSAGVGSGNQTDYVNQHDTNGTWEVGRGTVTGALLSRDTIYESSDSGAKVNFAAGNKTVRATVAGPFFNAALNEDKHDVLDHFGLPGVPAAEVFTQAVHDVLDHQTVNGVPAPEAFTQSAHMFEPHAGLPGIPTVVTATSGSGGDTEGTLTADSDKGLDIVGGVAEVKIDGATVTFDGSGQLQSNESFTSADHSTTDHSLIPTHPTATAYGANTETLVADKVLTNADPTYQFLTPSGANRKVTLPAVTGANPAFFIVNQGSNLLQIVEASGGLVVWLRPDEGVRVIPSGTAWAASSIENFAQPVLATHYTWGGNPANGNYLLVHRNSAQGGERGSSDLVGAYHVMHSAGTIDEIAWLMNSEGAIDHFEIYVNDVAQNTALVGTETRMSATGGGGVANGGRGFARLPLPIPVSAGQRIALRARGGGLNNIHVTLRVRGGSPGYRLDFGNNINANDAFYDINGKHDNASGNLAQTIDNTILLVGNGNLVSIAYAIVNADPADTLDVVVNGFQTVVTLTNGSVVNGALVGVETLNIAFSEGDTLAVRGNLPAVVALDNAHISIQTDFPGQAHIYMGNPGGDQCLRAWTDDENAGGVSFDSGAARSLSRRAGRVRASWSTTNLATLGMAIIRNLRESERVDITGSTTGATPTSLIVDVGDDLAVALDDGGEGNTNVLLVVGD